MTYNLGAKKINQSVPFRFFKAVLLSIKRSERDQCLQTALSQMFYTHYLTSSELNATQGSFTVIFLMNKNMNRRGKKNKSTIVSK